MKGVNALKLKSSMSLSQVIELSGKANRKFVDTIKTVDDDFLRLVGIKEPVKKSSKKKRKRN